MSFSAAAEAAASTSLSYTHTINTTKAETLPNRRGKKKKKKMRPSRKPKYPEARSVKTVSILVLNCLP